MSLPELNVVASHIKPAARRQPGQQHVAPPPTVPEVSATEQLTTKNNSFDQARSNLFTTTGTASDTISHDSIQAMPQGTNQTVERVLLQAPGVSQDSAASGLFHIRNDHANAQFRINGVMLPDGVTGFSTFLDADLIGNISLITGALPAEYGMRTTGVLDITTRNDIFNNSGSVSYYGGSRSTIQPSFEYGGTFGANCPATQLPGARKRNPRTRPATAACNIFSAAAICKTGKASKIRCSRSTPFTTSRSRKKASPICRRLSTRGRG